MRDPAKENTLALADTDIRGKDTAGGPDWSLSYPHTGLETSLVLEGILGRQAGLWLTETEKMLTAEI